MENLIKLHKVQLASDRTCASFIYQAGSWTRLKIGRASVYRLLTP